MIILQSLFLICISTCYTGQVTMRTDANVNYCNNYIVLIMLWFYRRTLFVVKWTDVLILNKWNAYITYYLPVSVSQNRRSATHDSFFQYKFWEIISICIYLQIWLCVSFCLERCQRIAFASVWLPKISCWYNKSVFILYLHMRKIFDELILGNIKKGKLRRILTYVLYNKPQ